MQYTFFASPAGSAPSAAGGGMDEGGKRGHGPEEAHTRGNGMARARAPAGRAQGHAGNPRGAATLKKTTSTGCGAIRVARSASPVVSVRWAGLGSARVHALPSSLVPRARVGPGVGPGSVRCGSTPRNVKPTFGAAGVRPALSRRPRFPACGSVPASAAALPSVRKHHTEWQPDLRRGAGGESRRRRQEVKCYVFLFCTNHSLFHSDPLADNRPASSRPRITRRARMGRGAPPGGGLASDWHPRCPHPKRRSQRPGAPAPCRSSASPL